MAYLVVENFSAGLDTRRHPLTARPGTLQKLKNAHVSRGGEIEKRKAFEVFNPYVNPNTFTNPFHGLQATADKIYTFTDGWNHDTGGNELPVGGTGLYAMILKHPSSGVLWAHSGPLPTLERIVYSTLYGGKTFVLAKWSTGEVIPYYDGEFIPDFYIGKTRSWMMTAANPMDVFAATLAWQVRGGTYGASTTGWDSDSSNLPAGGQSWVDVIAPADVDFTPSATADEGITITTSTITEFKAGTAAKKASGGFSITSGSLGTPASATRALQYVGSLGAAKIMNIYFDEQEAIDEPGGWTGFDATGFANTSTGLVDRINYFITNFSRNRDGLPNTPVGASIASYAYPRRQPAIGYIKLFVPNTSGTYFDDHSANNGKDIEIEFAADPSLVPGISQLIDVSTIAPSGFNAGRWTAKFASMAGGVTNAISQVLVDGVDVLGSPVKWTGSHSVTMTNIVDRINTFNSSPEYTASYANDKVTLTSVNTGADQNGRVIELKVIGNIGSANYSSFTGGADAVPATRKRVRYTFNTWNFTPDKKVTLIATKVLDPANPVYWGASRVTDATPTSALTFKTKAHVGSGSTMFFSAVNNPKKWGQDGVGAGFINMSNSSGGNEAISALATYQGNLAAFSRRTVQIWSIDTDPANNRQGQVLSNTGAFGPRSVVSVGDIDVFYLSDSGIRSLRARDSSNAAVVNDVGTPVDGLILNDISGMSFDEKAACPAVIEPVDGRYWIAIGDKIYVYSFFPSSQVAAWSTYEPGHTFTDFTTKDGKIYAKEGQYVYVYGGSTGQAYDSSPVEVVLPYLDGGKPAHTKTLMGLDMTCEGEWSVEIGMDPVNPVARDVVATVSQPTFTLGRIQANGSGTHVGVRLVNDAPGYARLANLICHFEFNESE
jgi:hypothetical protein